MKILLTGGSGFIGRYLKQHLAHEVVSPSSKELNLLNADQVSDYLKAHKFDAVIHAAVAGRSRVYDIDGDIADKNISMFYNLAAHKSCYGKFINFGSGAEFGLDSSQDLIREDAIHYKVPKESYGLSKNIIARSIARTENFYNLRIFACCDPSETSDRFVTKFKRTIADGRPFVVDADRRIDFFTLADTLLVVEAVLDDTIKERDVNLVYQDKLLTSEILNKYCTINNADASLIKVTGRGYNYTGDGSTLAKYNIGLIGLDATLEKYKD